MVTYNYNTGKPLAAGEKQATVAPSGQIIGTNKYVSGSSPTTANAVGTIEQQKAAGNVFNTLTGEKLNYGTVTPVTPESTTIKTPILGTPTNTVFPPSPKVDINKYSAITEGIRNSLLNADGTEKDSETQKQDVLNQRQNDLQSMIDSLVTPPSQTDIYNKALQQSGKLEAQQQVNSLTNQLGQITAQGQANQLSVVGQGRGIPEAIIGGQQAQFARETAIQALPVSAQLAAAQNNLEMATDNLNTLYKIQSEDAKANYEFKNKLITTFYDFADKESQRKLDDIKTKQGYEHDDLQNSLTQQNSYAKMAYENGQSLLGSKISKLDYKSPTFKEDLANLQAKLVDPVKAAQLRKLNAEIAGIDAENAMKTNGGASGDLTAYATSYADTGKLPSPAELKLSGLNVGQVTSMAKQIPREKGSVVSKLTGSKSTTVPALLQEDFSRLYNVLKMTERLKELDDKRVGGVISGTLGKIFGSEDQGEYLTIRKAIVDEISRMQSGAALTTDEVSFYKDYLPGRFSESLGLGQDSSKVIENFRKTMDSKLRNGADNNGLSVYGYSTVKVGNKDMTVGDVVDIEGESYRVLPDGTLTDIL